MKQLDKNKNNKLSKVDLKKNTDTKVLYNLKRLKKSTFYFFPGQRIASSDSNYFIKMNKEVRDSLCIGLNSNTLSLRYYLRRNIGVFSENYYASLLVPKTSTKRTIAGVSRDKKRTLLTKLSNINQISGLKLKSINGFNEALVYIHTLLKAYKGSSVFQGALKTYKDLLFLNTSYKDSHIPIINKLVFLINNTTPKFVIKKHVNRLPGRRKKKGPIPLRSYLAFIKPSGRKLSTLR
jgi:hypothetical protein